MRSRREFLTLAAYFLLAAADSERAEIDLEIILVPTKFQAEEVLERLKAGEAFDSLAKRFSIDVSATNGGYVGKVKVSH